MAMLNGGNILSGVGVVLFQIGAGYWLWFLSPGGRIAKLRSGSSWHMIGDLTIVGMLAFAAGRVLASRR